jgi:hypothetical protein
MVGGCLCRQVRYRAEVEPAFTTVCHCKNCQKQVGTAFTVWVAIPKSSLSVRGTVKTFHGKGDSSRAWNVIFVLIADRPLLPTPLPCLA